MPGDTCSFCGFLTQKEELNLSCRLLEGPVGIKGRSAGRTAKFFNNKSFVMLCVDIYAVYSGTTISG